MAWETQGRSRSSSKRYRVLRGHVAISELNACARLATPAPAQYHKHAVLVASLSSKLHAVLYAAAVPSGVASAWPYGAVPSVAKLVLVRGRARHRTTLAVLDQR